MSLRYAWGISSLHYLYFGLTDSRCKQSTYSPDCNQLYYYFWSTLRTKVYEDRREVFQDVNELQERIQTDWNPVVDIGALRKVIDQFLPRLRPVVKNKGRSIKAYFSCV